MDVLNVTRFVGGLSFIGSVIGNILGCVELGLTGSIVSTVCLGLDGCKEIIRTLSPDSVSGYSYLYDVQRFVTKEFRKKPIKPQKI